MVTRRRQHTHRPTISPHKACSANVYRCIKRRVVRSLKRAHCKRNLVTSRKQAAYKLPRTQSSFSSFKRVPGPLFRQDSPCSNRQHHGGVIHKQGRRHGGEVAGLSMQQNHSDCSRLAQHALVLGSGGHVQPNPIEPAHSAQPADTALQSDPSQKSDKSKSPCTAPRASAIKEQGFSEAVAKRIEAPQRRSTRSVFEAKWTIFTKWCISKQMDFRAPPVKSVADFVMYLF